MGRRDEWRPPRPNEGEWPSLNPKTASGRDVPLQDSNSVRYIGTGGLSASNVGTAIDELAIGRSANPHGAADHTNIVRTLWLSPGAITPDSATVGFAGTAPDRMEHILFADGSTQAAGVTFAVPLDWASGAIEFVYYFSGSTAFGAADTVRIETTVKEITDSADTVGAGTTTTEDVTPGVAYGAQDLLLVSTGATVTPSAALNVVRFHLRRLGGHANDDYTGNLRWNGLLVSYLATQ